MEIENVKKYLQHYLDDVITPEINRELVGEEDEPITIKVHDIKEKEHLPLEAVVFLDINPDWSSGSIIPRIDNDIRRFIVMMLGYKKTITVAWNKRTQPIYGIK